MTMIYKVESHKSSKVLNLQNQTLREILVLKRSLLKTKHKKRKKIVGQINLKHTLPIHM